MKTILLTVDDALHAKLKNSADAKGQTMRTFIRLAISEAVARAEKGK